MSSWSFLRRLPVGIAILSAAAFWTTAVQTKAATTKLRTALAERQYPHLLPGLKLDLVSDIVWRRPVQHRGPSAPGHRIVLVSSDTCPFCLTIEPQWCELLTRQRFAVGDEVLILSYSGAAIPDRLLQCAGGNTSLRSTNVGTVRDIKAFGITTGILGTPLMLVTSHDGVLLRSFGAGRRAAFEQFLETRH